MKPFFTGTLSSGLQSPWRTVNPDWHVGYHESHSCSESCCQTATGPWSKGGEMSPPWPHQCWVGKGRAHFAQVRESNQHCKNMVSMSRYAALLTCPSWLPWSASSPLWETLKSCTATQANPISLSITSKTKPMTWLLLHPDCMLVQEKVCTFLA